MRKFEHSSAVHTVHSWWCWSKHKFIGCLTHWMKWVILQILYSVGPQPILRRTVKMDELQVVGHIEIRNFVTCFVRLNLQSHGMLKSKTALTLQQQTLSGKCTSPIIPGLKKHTHGFIFRPMCCPADDRHWPLRNTDLSDAAKHYITMSIFMNDHPSRQEYIIIIKNKPEPSILNCIVLKLYGFHTLVIYLR